MTKRKPRKVGSPDPILKKIPGTEVEMEVRPEHGCQKHVPLAKPYIFPAELVEELAVGVEINANMALTGPTGCGKTSLVAMLASQLNQPFVRFNMNGETRTSHLVGMNKPATREGVLTLQFSPGAMVSAMQEGYWVLLDEIDAALPSVLMVLQSVLEEGNRALFIPETGETITPHPEFRIFATGNTIGYRNTARMRHAGTNPMNDAFVDRFGLVLSVDYPPKAEEIKRITANCPDIPARLADGIARVAENLRSDETFRSDFSTRRCVQWARLVPHFGINTHGVVRAAELAVIRKMTSPNDARVAREVIYRLFKYKDQKTQKAD